MRSVSYRYGRYALSLYLPPKHHSGVNNDDAQYDLSTENTNVRCPSLLLLLNDFFDFVVIVDVVNIGVFLLLVSMRSRSTASFSCEEDEFAVAVAAAAVVVAVTLIVPRLERRLERARSTSRARDRGNSSLASSISRR